MATDIPPSKARRYQRENGAAKALEKWNPERIYVDLDRCSVEREWLELVGEILDALLSEGCRGDLAEAAGFQSYAQNLKMGCEIGERKGRRETALKIADAIEQLSITYEHPMVDVMRAYNIARSFAEDSSGQVQAMLSGAVDRLNDPLTADRPEDIQARLENSDE